MVRVVYSEKDVVERLDTTTLTYLAVAAALLVLRDVKKLSFGDTTIEFAVKEAREAKAAALNAQAIALGSGKARPMGDQRSRGLAADDPWKGKFGQPCANKRCLEAAVRAVPGSADLFDVHLQVRSVDDKKPLTGVVQFFLHPTFNNSEPVVSVGPNGRAELQLRAWGAFTVGALADNGETSLELDLAELSSAPIEFRSR